MTTDNSSTDLQRLRELTLEKCCGTLSQEDVDTLSQLVAASPQARSEYWQLIALHSQLEWELHEKNASASDLARQIALLPDVVEPVPQSPVVASRSFPWLLAIAACLLIGWFVGNSGFRNAVHQPSQDTLVARSESLPSEARPVGTLTSLASNSHWSIGRPGGNNANDLHAGDTIWLESGAVEFRLTNNTVALMESPAIMHVVSLDRIRMIQGGVKVEVAKGAEGFSVETDSAEVIDLGTVFSVNVEDGNTDLVVFDGEVDLKVNSDKDHTTGNIESSVRRLRGGEAVKVSLDGTLSRIVNVRQSNFDGLEDELHRPLILSVRDNIVRSDFYRYYEIIPDGMSEDAKAFVDRPHEWNGIRSTGMPSYLVGGDYIKTFNDDKVTSDLGVEVQVAQPAVLYVLLDKRVSPPTWLEHAFEETGDEIGVDEAYLSSTDSAQFDVSELRKGAGKGINRQHSIWKRVMPRAGVVTLGANGELIDEVPEGVMSKANMYGVVAVPLGNDI